MTKHEKEMLNTLRWLARFNLGDVYEERIQKTLINVNKCSHRFHDGECVYCNKTRKQLRDVSK